MVAESATEDANVEDKKTDDVTSVTCSSPSRKKKKKRKKLDLFLNLNANHDLVLFVELFYMENLLIH